MTSVTIENNGELLNSADFFSGLWAAFDNTTYAQRLSAVLNGLRSFDISATTDFQSGGALSSYTNGQTTTVNLDRYQVEMTGTLSASGSRLSLYKITDLFTGDIVILSGDFQYNYYPLYPGTQLLPGSKITGFGIISTNVIGWAECNATLQSDYKTLSGTLSTAASFTLATDFTTGPDVPFYGLVAENSITFSFDLSSGFASFSGTTNSQTAGLATTSLEEIRSSGTFTWTDFIKVEGMSLGVNSSPTTDVFIGSDTVTMSGSFGSSFSAGSGNDNIVGSSNSDTIIGGAGNDSIYGEGGIDTVVFSGKRADYTIAKSGNEYIFIDLISNRDGTDHINGSEYVQFSDGFFALTNQFVNETSITKIYGNGVYSTAKGQIVASYYGLSVGEFVENYIPLFATSSKNYVPPKGSLTLLAYETGELGIIIVKSAKSFAEQKFFSNGLANGKSIKLTLDQMYNKENSNDIDLNSDGFIGDVVSQVIDGNGDSTHPNIGLYKLISGRYAIGQTDSFVGESVNDSVVLMSTIKKAWTVKPTTAVLGISEMSSGDFEILTRTGSSIKAQVFDDLTGLALGKAIALKIEDLESREYFYGVDLNADGVISLVGQETPPIGW